MTKASDNAFPSILITEGTEPSAPAAGKQRMYIDSTSHVLMLTNSSGTESVVGAAGGMATDALWDAAGDLAVGTGANTGAKLVKGAAGGNLGMVNGAVAWTSGTAPPGSAVTGDRTYLTDVLGGITAIYDGTRWVSEQIFRLDMPALQASISASGLMTSYCSIGWAGGFDLWLIAAYWNFSLGATNDAGKYWNLAAWKTLNAGGADASLATSTTQSLTASQQHTLTAAIGALATTGVTQLYGYGTKVSTPSNLQCAVSVTYRLVVT